MGAKANAFNTFLPVLGVVILAGLVIYNFKYRPVPVEDVYGRESKALSAELNAHNFALTLLSANAMSAEADPRRTGPYTVIKGIGSDGKSFSYASAQGDICPPFNGVKAVACVPSIGFLVEVRSGKDRGVWVEARTTADRETSNAHEVAAAIQAHVVAALTQKAAEEKAPADRAASWAADGVSH